MQASTQNRQLYGLQINWSAKVFNWGRWHLTFKGFSTTLSGKAAHTTKSSIIMLIVKGEIKTMDA